MKSHAVRLLQRVLLSCASSALLAWAAAPAIAQEAVETPPAADPDAATLARLEQSILQQAELVAAQQRELERQTIVLAEQQEELKRQLIEIAVLKGQTTSVNMAAAPPGPTRMPSGVIRLSDADLLQVAEAPIERDTFSMLRAGRSPQGQAAVQRVPSGPAVAAVGPARTVGQAPPGSNQPAAQLAALPENIGILTPPGKLIIDPSFEYANTSGNRLVFRGVEIVTGVQIGVIEASDVDRNTLTSAFSARFGVTDRLEVEMRAPYIYRNDEIMTLAQRDDTITRSIQLEGHDMGDIEVAARYQFTDGRDGMPIVVGNLRYKSNTGTGPFDVARDEFGIARELPTGSGFWGVEPGLSFLMPSDPAVLFATVGYLYHAPDRIDRTINGVQIGEVDPGDSINASLGFGFAVNPAFSFSLGYRHSYILPTKSELGATVQESDDIHAGSVQLGLSYRFNEKTTINTNFEFGMTEDAPDARVVFRIPFSG